MADLFEEVEEQLRSARYLTLARQALPWVLGAFLVGLIAALAVWGWGRYQEQAAAKASEEYQAALETFVQGGSARAFQQLDDVAKSPAKGYKSLALMQQGGIRLSENKVDEAVKLFDAAADAAPNDIIGDAARLKSAFALLDSRPYKDVEARLTPLMKEDRPYRVLAREARAFAMLAAGDTAGARGEFVVISLLPDAPEDARQRAGAAISLIDSGSAKQVPAAIKAAAALPPQAPLPPGVIPSGPPPQESAAPAQAAPAEATQPAAPQQQAPGTQ